MDRNNRTFIYVSRVFNDKINLPPLMKQYGMSNATRFFEKVTGLTLPEMHDAAIAQGIPTSTWLDLAMHQMFPDRWPNKPRMIARRGYKKSTAKPKIIGGNVRYKATIYLRPEVHDYWAERAKSMLTPTGEGMDLSELIAALLHRNYDKLHNK